MPKDLPWYERDELMTWYNHWKCGDFLRDADKHFQQAKIVNFDIIHRQCCGEEIPKELLQYYQTVNDKTASQNPNTENNQISYIKGGQERYFSNKKLLKVL